MIKEFNKKNLGGLRTDIANALKSVEATYGITFEVGSCSYSSNKATFNLACFAAGNGKENEAKRLFEEFCRVYKNIYGLEASDFGREFTMQGKVFKICGYNPKSRKYSLIASDPSGAAYKFEPRTVADALGRKANVTLTKTSPPMFGSTDINIPPLPEEK